MKAILLSSDKCGSCKLYKPVFQDIMMDFDIEYKIIDDDEVKNYNIGGLPTTIFTDDDGNELGRIMGNVSSDELIKQILYYGNTRQK